MRQGRIDKFKSMAGELAREVEAGQVDPQDAIEAGQMGLWEGEL